MTFCKARPVTDNQQETPHDYIAALIEGDFGEVPPAPHPDDPGFPIDTYTYPGEDDEVDPGVGTLPPDADRIASDVLAACAGEPQNDTGNGKRLLNHFGADLLHVRNVGWHAWAGTHWEREGGNEIAMRHAQETAAYILLEADHLASSPNERRAIEAATQAKAELAELESNCGEDEKPSDNPRYRELMAIINAGAKAQRDLQGRQSARRKYSVSSGNSGKIKGMLEQAAPHRTVTIDDLDADPLSFNVLNGTIRFVFDRVRAPAPGTPKGFKMVKHWRAELTEARRGDNITKVAPVEYIPGAHRPAFDAAVSRFLPVEAVRSFVQRYHGYALTGLTGEQCFTFSYGTGSNWKSTFTEIVSRIMGPYCATINFESLTGDQQRSGSGPSPDLARLPGARLVRASEPERGVQFKEALIKSLTGGEPMLVRGLHKDFFEFRPTFKLALSGNHKLEIGGVDHGIWRRVKFVPWPVTIADHEKRPMDEVMSELDAERSGILNWLIDGALAYLNDGLKTPPEVADATAEYRDEMDPVGQFITACVQAVPASPDGGSMSAVSAREMYDAFAAWATANAVRPWKEKSFGMAMGQKGFVKDRTKVGVRYLHVMLKDVPENKRRVADQTQQPVDDDAVPV
jgi:putative DNA primase/helicase